MTDVPSGTPAIIGAQNDTVGYDVHPNQKNEIANGMRLENASWRTWWKQRNKLRTISPETLNWCVSPSDSLV